MVSQVIICMPSLICKDVSLACPSAPNCQTISTTNHTPVFERASRKKKERQVKYRQPKTKYKKSINTTNIVNLTGQKLPYPVRTLLGRGLSFIPTQKNRNTQQELVKDLDNFKKKYVDKWMMELPNRARRILRKTMQSIEYDLRNCTYPIHP